MITVHKLRVRNKASKEEFNQDIHITGDIEAAKAHVNATPPSRGAPLGLEVVGEAKDETVAEVK